MIRLSHVSIPLLLLALSAPARADDDDRKARSTIRPPARPADADRLRRGESKHTDPTAWDRLKEELKELSAGRVLRRGTTAVYLVDAETGEELYAAHADEKLNPASNVKLVSTAAVLDTLGPDWRFRTRVYGPAPDADRVVRGDLYLLGQADPTLGPKRLAWMAREIAESGIERVEGSVVISSDVLRDTIGLPRIKVTVKGAAKAGEPPEVEVSPSSDYVRVEVTAKTRKRRRGRRLRIRNRLEETEAGEPRQVIEVSGTIPRGRTLRKFRGVRKRSSFTAHTLRAALIEAGVEVTGSVEIAPFEEYALRAGEAGFLPVVLMESRSRPIEYLVQRTNKRSLNFLADRLVIAAGAQAFGGHPSMERGVALMEQWLEKVGVNAKNVTLDTGSGLSYKTELSARQIVEVLRSASGYDDDGSELKSYPSAFLRSLAVGGVDGTLRSRFRGSPARGKVVGKTGTLTRIIALSGFLEAGERTLCFALVTNGHRGGHRWNVRREHEHLVEAMLGFLKTEARLARAKAEEKPSAAPSGATAEAEAPADSAGH